MRMRHAGSWLLTTALVLSVPLPAAANAADGDWTGIVEINPASDMVDEAGPECRDGRIRLSLHIAGDTVSGEMLPLGNPGAPGFDRGAIPISGSYGAATDRLQLRSGPNDYHFNRLHGDLQTGTWRNATCWGEYRLWKSS